MAKKKSKKDNKKIPSIKNIKNCNKWLTKNFDLCLAHAKNSTKILINKEQI